MFAFLSWITKDRREGQTSNVTRPDQLVQKTHAHLCTYSHTHAHIYAHVHTRTYSYTRAHTHILIHTCTHMHTHVYTRLSGAGLWSLVRATVGAGGVIPVWVSVPLLMALSPWPALPLRPWGMRGVTVPRALWSCGVEGVRKLPEGPSSRDTPAAISSTQAGDPACSKGG